MASWGIPLPAGKLHPNLSDRFYFYNSLYFIKYGRNDMNGDGTLRMERMWNMDILYFIFEARRVQVEECRSGRKTSKFA